MNYLTVHDRNRVINLCRIAVHDYFVIVRRVAAKQSRTISSLFRRYAVGNDVKSDHGKNCRIPSFITRAALLLLTLTCCVASATPLADDDTTTKPVGWLEKVYISNDKDTMELIAKLDTGAKTSSIGAEDISFDSQGNVRFTVRNNKGRKIYFKRKIIAESVIKNRLHHANNSNNNGNNDGSDNEEPNLVIIRPVVEINVCIHAICQDILVNLANRTNFNYQLLIGRNTLKRCNFIVNPAKTFTIKKS